MQNQSVEAHGVGALSGVRVLDMSRILAGPWATQLLGDLGADVLKIEKPGLGDDTRSWGPPFVGADADSDAAYFTCANRNKASVTVDFTKPEGSEILRRLIPQHHVFVENFKHKIKIINRIIYYACIIFLCKISIS